MERKSKRRIHSQAAKSVTKSKKYKSKKKTKTRSQVAKSKKEKSKTNIFDALVAFFDALSTYFFFYD
jgi:cbb3-type cytochrome oxidase cytochrome c subunit